MKKIGIFVALLSVQLFAFHDLAIVPTNPRAVLDTFTFNGSYEHNGDTAMITALFFDENKNGVLDGKDVDILNGTPIRVIDGGTPKGRGPYDDVKDGLMKIVSTAGEEPFSSIGTYICIIGSDGIADSVSFTIVEAESNTYVKGNLKDPDGIPADGVAIRAEILNSSNAAIYSTSVVADVNGNLVIYFSDTYRNHKIRISLDPEHSKAGALEPDWIMEPLETMLVDSLVNLQGTLKRDSHIVMGTVKDEKGNSIANKAFYLNESGGIDRTIGFTTDSKGSFSVKASAGTYDMYMDDRNGAIDYIYNVKGFTITAETDTFKINYLVYTADTKISGIVSDGGTLSGNGRTLIISATGIKSNTYYKGTSYIESNGKYSINISSAIDSYTVVLSLSGFPEEYKVFPQYYYPVKSGADTCDAFIKICKVKVSGIVKDSTGAALSAGVFFVDQADGLRITVNSNASGQFTQVLPQGVYKIYCTGFSQTLHEYVGGYIGPITVSDKDTSVQLVATVSGYGQGTANKISKHVSMPGFSFVVNRSKNNINLRFSNPVTGTVRVSMFDLRGRLITIAYNKDVEAGNYCISLNLSKLSASKGFVIAKLVFTGEQNYSKTVVIR